MQQLQSIIHGAVAESRRILIEDLLLLQLDEHGDVQGEQLPPIDWANVVDNPTEQKRGWSFLKDVRNQFDNRFSGRDWLARRVIEKPNLGSVANKGGCGFKPILVYCMILYPIMLNKTILTIATTDQHTTFQHEEQEQHKYCTWSRNPLHLSYQTDHIHPADQKPAHFPDLSVGNASKPREKFRQRYRTYSDELR